MKTNLKRWEKLSSVNEYKNKFFSIENRSYKLPNGHIINDYYRVHRSNYVIVIAINKNNEVLIEKTYRQGIDDFVYEFPEGWIDSNENPLEAGVRELREETGYGGQAELLGEFYVQPGYINQRAYVVYIKLDDAKTINHNREVDEDIEVEFLKKEVLDKMISRNEMKDMGMLSAIAMYDRIKKNK